MIIDGTLGLDFPDGSDQTTAFTGNAATITSGTIATARLATGTANASTYLRGDQTWASVPAGTRISGGTTGLTPNTLTSGDVTLAGILAVASGGTGTATPSLVGGTNVTISGSWPNQTVTSTAAAGGKVLQVVQTVKSDTFTTTVQDETFVDITGLSVNITPTSATSRILVFVSLGKISVSASGRAINFRLLRNSTAIGLGDADGNRIRCTFASQTAATDVAGRGGAGMSYSFLDSPATTSLTTYKVSMSGHDGDLTCINRSAENQNSNDAPHSRTSSTIIVMEIAA